jgi:hypothetical protein
MVYAPRSAGRTDAWIMLGIFAAAVAYLVELPRGLAFGDESVLLYEAKRIRDGEVMYRDFFQFVTPVAPHVIAAAYWVFGTSMATARAAMAVVHGLTAILLYACARRLAVRRGFAIAVPLAYLGVMQPLWPVVSWHWFSTCFTMLLVWMLVADPAQRPRRWALLEGVAAGLLIGTQQQKGLVVAAGACLVFLAHALIQQRYGVPGAWRRAVARVVWFAVGTALVSLPLLAVFVAVAGGETLYDALIRFPLENYREHLRSPWGYIGLSAPTQAVLSYPVLLRYAPWAALPPLLYAIVACAGGRDRQAVQQLAAVVILSAASTLSIWYYPDLFHIAFIAPPFALCAAVAAELLAGWASAFVGRGGDAVAAVAATAVAVVLAWHLATNAVFFWQLYPVPYESAFGRVDLTHRWQAAIIDQLRAKLDRTQSRGLFCYSNLTGLYLLTGGHNPTRYQYLHATVSPPAQVQDALAALAREDVPYAVLKILGRASDPIIEFVETHYRASALPPEQLLKGAPLFFPYERKRASPDGAAAP